MRNENNFVENQANPVLKKYRVYLSVTLPTLNESSQFTPIITYFYVSSQYIKDFYNKTVINRTGAALNAETLTLMYSLTVSVFAIGGLLGSLIVGMLVTRFGR